MFKYIHMREWGKRIEYSEYRYGANSAYNTLTLIIRFAKEMTLNYFMKFSGTYFDSFLIQ